MTFLLNLSTRVRQIGFVEPVNFVAPERPSNKMPKLPIEAVYRWALSNLDSAKKIGGQRL